MKIMFTLIIAVCFAIVIGLLLMIRTADHDPAVWHVDPLTFTDPPTPNFYRVGPSDKMPMKPQMESPVYVGSPQLLMEAFDTFVMGQPRVERINPVPESAIADGWVTYVQTTPQIGFPDYISVRFIDNGDGTSSMALISRSRFGHGDLGVNEARVQSWLPGLESFVLDPNAPRPGAAEEEAAVVDDGSTAEDGSGEETPAPPDVEPEAAPAETETTPGQ
jgi:Protein of unknown function (DUF1499)